MNELTTKPEWKKYLQDAHGGTKEAMLEEAKRLYEYQQHCASKSGGSDFSENVLEWCGYEKSTALKMAAVGGNSFLRNNVPKLPESWGTCYEITTLDEGKRKSLPLSPSLTRNQVKNWKNYGTLEAPEVKVVKDAEGTTEVEEAAVLVPSLELYGLSDFGKSALEKDRKKLQEAINKLPASQSKRFVELFVEVLKYHQNILLSEIRRQIPESIAVQRQKLEEKEKQLFARETQLAHGIPANEKKIVYSVLHPDKAPDGMEQKYAKAFDIVRKWR